MEKELCMDCQKELTAEERLLNAIYGDAPICKDCYDNRKYPHCTKCGKPTKDNLYYNNLPYHTGCLLPSNE